MSALLLKGQVLAAAQQVESARKLRWYDRDDLSQLVALHSQEKHALQATVSALRQVLSLAAVYLCRFPVPLLQRH